MDIEKIQIITAANKNYAGYLACFLSSIAKSHLKQHSLQITVIHPDIDLESQQQFNSLIPMHPISWIELNTKLITHLKVASEFLTCPPHYYRLLTPYLLKDHFKALYLDVDTMVLKDLYPLWMLDLNQHLGAAKQDYLPTIKDAVDNWKELRLDPHAVYYNTGVLLMNLTLWRRQNISEKVIKTCYQNSQYLLAQKRWPQYDQYGINVHLQGGWKTLTPKWNHGTDMDVLEDACIIHFIGNGKIGLPKCHPHYTTLFYETLEQTPFYRWRPSFQ